MSHRGKQGRRKKNKYRPPVAKKTAETSPLVVSAADTDLVLAVVVGRPGANGSMNIIQPRVYGSAFAIGNALFLTADHVLRYALKVRDGAPGAVVALAHRSRERELVWAPVVEHEHHGGIDMALLRCPEFADPPRMPLLFQPARVLAPVSSYGYPHAVNTAQLSLVHRGFAGHVSTRRELVHLSAQPSGYELTFPSPGGLSGAPLLLGNPTRGLVAVLGWMIQSWRYETTTMNEYVYECGMAVASDTLLSVHSAMLGSPLAHVLGEEVRQAPSPTPVRNPNMVPYDTSTDGWPEV